MKVVVSVPLLILLASPLRADTLLGACTATSYHSGIVHVWDVGAPCKLFKDEQGSYYMKVKKRFNDGEDRWFEDEVVESVTPGHDVRYRPTGGGDLVEVFQPRENKEPTTEKLHERKDGLFDSLLALSAAPGDFVYPLLVPEDLQNEYLAYTPPAFGDLRIESISYYGLKWTPDFLSILGSSTLDGMNPVALNLDVGQEFFTFGGLDPDGRRVLQVLSSDESFIDTNQQIYFSIDEVPEPGVLSLLALGSLAAVIRNHRRRTAAVRRD